jgi:hypothetical protein
VTSTAKKRRYALLEKKVFWFLYIAPERFSVRDQSEIAQRHLSSAVGLAMGRSAERYGHRPRSATASSVGAGFTLRILLIDRAGTVGDQGAPAAAARST